MQQVGQSGSFKRTRDNGNLDKEPPSKQPRYMDFSSRQCFMNIAIINQINDITQNVVWMNNEDHALFFPNRHNTRASKSNYIQIAERIYEVAQKNWLPQSTIALTASQFKECEQSKVFFHTHSGLQVQVSTFSAIQKKHQTISSLIFLINNHQEFEKNDEEMRVYDLKELRALCLNHLKNKYVTAGQAFVIASQLGRINLIVQKIKFTYLDEMQEVKSNDSFGLISELTQISFKSQLSWKGIIVAEEKKCADKFVFKVSLSESEMISQNSLPVYVDREELSKKISSFLKGRKVVLGTEYTLMHNNMRYNVFTYKIGEETSSNALEKNYHVSYQFDSNRVKLRPCKDIQFTFGGASKAEKLEVLILSAKEREGKNIQYKYLNALDIEHEIKKNKNHFVLGQRFHLNLANALVNVEMKYAEQNSCPEIAVKGCKKLWTLDENISIDLKNDPQNKWSLIDSEESVAISSMTLKVEAKNMQKIALTEMAIMAAARSVLKNGIMVDQNFKCPIKGDEISFTVTSFDYPNKKEQKVKYGLLGKISEMTEIKLLNQSLSLAITSRAMVKDPFARLNELGFGGLSAEGKKTLSKIIHERRSPMKEEMQKRGLQPSKGLLLYGPPGTGKTLLARSLGSIFGCSSEHLRVLSGTEIYQKWVGASEANVRALFAPAVQACKKFKDESDFFLLIIDEIDGILSQRQSNSSNRWQNTVVNEFLAQMDGLEQLNNILVVGMTNRLEDLDTAIVRSGRFDDQIQLDIPDLEGRKEILRIHCKEMSDSKLLLDIDFDSLAKDTQGMSGAEIRSFVKRAANCALERLRMLVLNNVEIKDDCLERLTTMKDFYSALKMNREKLAKNKTHFGMYV